MKFQSSALFVVAVASSSSTNAFTTVSSKSRTSISSLRNDMINVELPSIESQIAYKPGAADTEFARRVRRTKIRWRGRSYRRRCLCCLYGGYGFQVNALYKNMVTDLVGTIHLIVVNARFQRDPVWSLGILTALDLLLKNYPEAGMYEKISSALFKSCNLDEYAIRAEAKKMEEWAVGKTREDIEAALKSGDDSSPLGAIASSIKADEFWMYSRYFGIGLVKIMDIVGIEMDKDEVYPIMENWMSTQLGRSHLSACVSSSNNHC